jgi:KDO2-lipid IV(A) lauroyltransferase
MERAQVAEPRRTATKMYRALGVGLMELVAMALGRRRRLVVRLPTEARRVIESERGALIATAHTGNWDLVACAIAERAPLSVATKRLSIGFLDRLWQSARRGRGVRLVEVGDVARAARAGLAQGELFAMMIDQAPERTRGAVRAEFLGERAWVDLAPALVAARAGVPLVVAFPRRLADGTHTVEVAGVIEPPPRAGRAWAEAAMAQATAWLDAFVREHPEQWLWMHRRWKDAPKPANQPLGVRHERAIESP